jgi:Fe-S-cluster-containing dehydrogenase component/formate-dependent nitrite reductase membrane component NrfD
LQLGFVIDHSRCIGCHACTVACKSENDVPLGSFRTWVKYVEEGTFPQVKRSFAVLRCNQCTDAPCVSICPVTALEKRDDGIVDVDPKACIGCKGCMQACPYDALYINESTGTAQKCHFCAHRTERGLAPACAVVCPTEAIIPGDFHDPDSVVSRLRDDFDLKARKTEAGTGPNVYYREASEAGIDPLLTNAAGGYLWANRVPGPQLAAEEYLAAEEDAITRASARTTYDVDHQPLWGWKVSLYMLTKSLAAGIFLLATLLGWNSLVGQAQMASLGGAALAFLAVTTALLIADLKKPSRFLLILTRPNWSSWLARGSLVLMSYGALLAVWTALWIFRPSPAWSNALGAVGGLFAALTACYTGWLFGQSKGRVLWMRRGLWAHLIVQALVAGGAFVLLVEPWLNLNSAQDKRLQILMIVFLGVHLAFALLEPRLAPARRRREYTMASRLLTHGPFQRRRMMGALLGGVGLPLLLLLFAEAEPWNAVAALAALAGLYVEDDVLVRAGQALPIS